MVAIEELNIKYTKVPKIKVLDQVIDPPRKHNCIILYVKCVDDFGFEAPSLVITFNYSS